MQTTKSPNRLKKVVSLRTSYSGDTSRGASSDALNVTGSMDSVTMPAPPEISLTGPDTVPSTPTTAAAAAPAPAVPVPVLAAPQEDAPDPVRNTDATKEFRRELNAGVHGIFEAFRVDLGKMELRIKAANISSLEKDELSFFDKQDEKELQRLKDRQAQELERVKRAFATTLESRNLRKRGKVLQASTNFTAKNRDIIIQEQDKAQSVTAEVKTMLDDHRTAFEELLEQTELRHTKTRKQLSASQERKIQDKRTLIELETAHMTHEMRQDRLKDFQFKMNHQKSLDKKMAEHLRDAQALEIRQMKEMFDLEIKSLEETHNLKAAKARDLVELQETHRRDVQKAKDVIRDVEFLVRTTDVTLRHEANLHALQALHAEEIKMVVARQDQLRAGRMRKWREILRSETGLSGDFAAEQDAGLALASLFMDPETTITKRAAANAVGDGEDPAAAAAAAATTSTDSALEAALASLKLSVMDAEAAVNGKILDLGSALVNDGTAAPGAAESSAAVHGTHAQRDERERLQQKLERIREELRQLRDRHKAQLRDLVKKQQEEVAVYETTIKRRITDLTAQHKRRTAQLLEQQRMELESLHATQAKESAMEESVRSAEHKMLMERKTLNSVLEVTVDGIISITPLGIITRFNAAAEAIFGYSAGEVLGRNIKILQPEEIAVVHDDLLKNYLETGVRRVIGIGRVAQGRRRDGSLFPLHLSISEVKENDMHLFTGIVRDLTAEVAAQEADRRETERKRTQMELLIQQLARERSKSADLIHSMLPASIVTRMLQGDIVPPESFDDATVLFTEIDGFSELCSRYTALDVVDLLDTLYCVFDEILLNYKVYKVETIQDSLVVVGGVPEPDEDHASEIAKLALHFTKAMTKIRMRNNPDVELKLKIGIHSGAVVAGVVGKKCSRYCLFGDTVNTASRMKSTSEPSCIQLSTAAQKRLAARKEPFQMQRRGEVSVKGKGTMETFWLTGLEGFEPDLGVVDRMMVSQRSLASFATTSFSELQSAQSTKAAGSAAAAAAAAAAQNGFPNPALRRPASPGRA
ncbi:hypothetical protein GGF31_000587 [Allomyces arbusculus]|nr:hypothetical protein GGF31_000587 [Allomyces arbusculus]